jgi:hypothetical protein
MPAGLGMHTNVSKPKERSPWEHSFDDKIHTHVKTLGSGSGCSLGCGSGWWARAMGYGHPQGSWPGHRTVKLQMIGGGGAFTCRATGTRLARGAPQSPSSATASPPSLLHAMLAWSGTRKRGRGPRRCDGGGSACPDKMCPRVGFLLGRLQGGCCGTAVADFHTAGWPPRKGCEEEAFRLGHPPPSPSIAAAVLLLLLLCPPPPFVSLCPRLRLRASCCRWASQPNPRLPGILRMLKCKTSVC